MDRFFVDSKNIDLDKGQCFIEGEDVKHISRVLRCNIGDKLEICDGNNNEYICEISNITKKQVFFNIAQKININRESNIKVKIYQGLPKGQKMDLILQKSTEVGVSEIIPVITKRSVAKIDGKKDKKIERWERIIYEAAKQSKRGIIPKVKGPLTFEEALLDMKNNDLNLVPYEKEDSKSIKNVLKGVNINSIGIFIGPEGGFEEEEIHELKNIGGISVSLGPRILRTETASIVVSSIVLYELSDLKGDE
ncbi:16S rRNA (uracil(1498)-N(3))-methyltransferase [Tepidibacter formicigenes]|uniref:Ribosomal RNA small subunit methyltransferase E n=1 Tax=Tepidibacter formicigenes DSM 15518 TaxID=1123349 RepID=A0A1M6LW70_9FIRM|nr:16S rRNA (uracil(1498)-N(3))-methyltransferase [Tepidibacter formicigenes]SHJ75426.1 16S rRNA (uracil1498-N3)-methyltransferase [Tepidibacter formicigenes DSM 15518]